MEHYSSAFIATRTYINPILALFENAIVGEARASLSKTRPSVARANPRTSRRRGLHTYPERASRKPTLRRTPSVDLGPWERTPASTRRAPVLSAPNRPGALVVLRLNRAERHRPARSLCRRACRGSSR